MITQEELKKLERLAKLSFSDAELEKFTQKLDKVVTMISSLEHVDCGDAEPLRSTCDMVQRMREDAVTAGDISKELFSNVPAANADLAREVRCFVVPKIVE